MPISEHPQIGTILLCDFSAGFKEPEMVKRRPVVVISPKISVRAGLCTVAPLSTTAPMPTMPYHCRLEITPPLPPPWDEGENWVKGDMICAIGFHRLDFIRVGKDVRGNRLYRYEPLPAADIRRIRCCVLSALGLSALTPGLP